MEKRMQSAVIEQMHPVFWRIDNTFPQPYDKFAVLHFLCELKKRRETVKIAHHSHPRKFKIDNTLVNDCL